MVKPPTGNGGGGERDSHAHAPRAEVLEELGDDAIVAEQGIVHAPAPRQHVVEEARTVVIAEQAPDPLDTARTAQRPRYDPRRYDPTVVVRAVRGPLPGMPKRPGQQTSWLPWLIWGIAGLIAFAVGGYLALWSAKRAHSDDAAPAEPASGRTP